MSKSNEIRHTGKILEITPDFTTVQIVVSSACSACHARAMCGMSEDEEKVIMVPTDPYSGHDVGDEVQVLTKMKNASWLDNLKFRVSYGVTGNNNVGDYVTASTASGPS